MQAAHPLHTALPFFCQLPAPRWKASLQRHLAILDMKEGKKCNNKSFA